MDESLTWFGKAFKGYGLRRADIQHLSPSPLSAIYPSFVCGVAPTGYPILRGIARRFVGVSLDVHYLYISLCGRTSEAVHANFSRKLGVNWRNCFLCIFAYVAPAANRKYLATFITSGVCMAAIEPSSPSPAVYTFRATSSCTAV